MKIERTRIHFFSQVFGAVAVLGSYGPYYVARENLSIIDYLLIPSSPSPPPTPHLSITQTEAEVEDQTKCGPGIELCLVYSSVLFASSSIYCCQAMDFISNFTASRLVLLQ